MEETFTSEQRGVTVSKSVDVLEPTDVRIEFRIDSEWSDTVGVRVVDSTREEWDVQVPDQDADRWTATEDSVEYEGDLQSDEPVRTAYKIACEDGTPDAIVENQSAPSIEVDPSEAEATSPQRGGEPALVAAGTDSGRSDDAVPGAALKRPDSRANREDEPDPEDGGEFAMPDDEMLVSDLIGDAEKPDETTNTGESNDENTDEAAASTDAAERGAISDGGHVAERSANPVPGDSGGSDAVVEALIDGLEAESKCEQRDRLERVLADVVRPNRSLQVQVARLQSRFEELAAYADALEEFIDENGTADEMLAEFQDELQDVRSTTQAIAADHADTDERLDDAVERIDGLENRVESRLENAEEDRRALEDSLAGVAENQRDVRERVAELEAFRESVQEAFGRTPAESD